MFDQTEWTMMNQMIFDIYYSFRVQLKVSLECLKKILANIEKKKKILTVD